MKEGDLVARNYNVNGKRARFNKTAFKELMEQKAKEEGI